MIALLTRQSGNVHLGQVAGLEDDDGESVGSRLVAEGDEQLATSVTVDLREQYTSRSVRVSTGFILFILRIES